MFSVICTLAFVSIASGLPFMVEADVEGRVLKSSDTKYLVDFTEGLKKYKSEGDYSKILINKNECIKL